MIRKTVALLLAVAAIALPAGASAQSVEQKNLISGKAKFDPTKGYIFIRGPFRQNAMFLRLPDDADKAEYEKNWAEGLVKAKEKYVRQLKRWEKDVEVAKLTKEKPPERPVEPTEANFSIGAIEMWHTLAVGPQFIFAKTESGETKEFSYLNAVKPGTYVYYGPIFAMPNGGYFGSCYCMGTVSFEVKAGAVTDLGNFLLVGPGADPDFPSTDKLEGSEAGLYRPQQLAKEFGPLSYGLPDTIKSWASAPADWRAHGHIPNHLGITVMRMPPVDGVLAYRRDVVVDVKAEAAAEAAKAAAIAPEAATTAAPVTGR